MDLGSFQLEHRLAAGGVGEIWSATQRDTGAPVAVKVVPALRDPRLRAAFADEVRAVARLAHPHVVRVFEHGRTQDHHPWPDCPWLAMERAPSTLVELSEPTWPVVFRVLQELLCALGHAHARGVVHRDVKASNVLIRDDGRVALADFGIARLGPQALDAGTPGCMAPEQLRAQGWRQGPWTDLYALGCLAWELLTGGPIFDDATWVQDHLHRSPPPFKARTPIPDGVDRWILALLEKEPTRRPTSAAEAARSLTELGGPWSVTRDDAPVLKGVGASLLGLRPVPLIGRQREQAQLRAALARVEATEQPAAVVLRGPSGIGKTRLAQELVWALREEGRIGLMARHGPDGADGVLDALREELSGMPLERALALRGAPPRDTTALASLLDAPDTIEAPVRRAVAARTLDDLAPLLLVIDDAQWALDGLELCERLLRDGSPVLVVLTVQDEALRQEAEAEALLANLDAEHIALAPLAEDALATAVLGLDDAATTTLADRSAGNPLMAVHLVSDWAQHGLLEPTARGYQLVSGAKPRMPADLRALWSERLERVLGAADCQGLELAAIGGLAIDTARWEQVCAEAGVAADGLERLLSAGLALRREGRWRLVHAMVREALLERCSPRWPAYHAAWARVLEQDGATPGRIAHHRVGAGEVERASPLLAAEVQRLWRHGDFARVARAIALWEQAAQGETGGQAELWRCRLALVREGVDAAAARVEAFAPHAVGLAHALDLQRCHHAWMRGDLEAALALAQRVATTNDAALARQAGRDRGRLLAVLGRHAEAREVLERTLTVAEEAGDDFVACVCLDGLAEAAVVAQDLKAVRRYAQRQRALCIESGFRVWEVSALHWSAVADLLEGRPAVEPLTRSRQRSQDLGQPTCHTAGALAVALAIAGDLERAAGVLDEATSEARELGWEDTLIELEAYRLVLRPSGPDAERALAACETLRSRNAVVDLVLRHVNR